MPHGFQWSPEDIYNARRAAEFQAEAIREAYKDIQKQQERDAERAARRQNNQREQVRERPEPKPDPHPECAWFRSWNSAQHRAAWLKETIAQTRAKNARNAVPGSATWILNRYGNENWLAKVKEYRKRFRCTKEEAEQLIVRDFKEEEWEHLKNERVEELLGYR